MCLRSRIYIIIFAVISCFCVIFIFNNSNIIANSNPTIYADPINSNTGENIRIPIKIKDNIGIMGFEIIASCDNEALQIQSVEKSNILSGTFDSFIVPSKDNEVHVLWSGVSAMADDGILFYINCNIKDDYNAESLTINVKSINNDTFDEDYKGVLLVCEDILIDINNYVESKPDNDSIEYTVYADQMRIENDELTIPVMLKNNKGIMGFVIDIDYDEDVITPIKIEPGTLITANSIFDTNIGNSNGSLRVLWSGSDAVKEDGSMFNVVFGVKEDISKDKTDIKLTYSSHDTFDEIYNDVLLNISDISVNLKKAESETGKTTATPTAIPTVTPTISPDIGSVPTRFPENNKPLPSKVPVPTATLYAEEKIDNGNGITDNNDTVIKTKLKKLSIKSLKSKKRKILMKWNASKDKISGYEVQYSIKKRFGKKTVKKVSKKRTSLTFTKLKSKKKYYVRIRSYKRYALSNGTIKIIYSNWSNVKSCKVK